MAVWPLTVTGLGLPLPGTGGEDEPAAPAADSDELRGETPRAAETSASEAAEATAPRVSDSPSAHAMWF